MVGLHAGFAVDDPMNIYYYWTAGPGQLVRNLALFFTTFQRPMGGVYYSALYAWFGLDPFPYHAVQLALVGVNTWLAYRFGALISGSRLAGGICALVSAYHVKLIYLYTQPAFIFDVLCFTFYFLALDYYLSIRTRGEPMTAGRIASFLLLYIGALESKEMAVTLPAVVLAWEALRKPGERRFLAALLAGGVALAFVLGKAFGSDSLLSMEAYRPVFTAERYFESTARFLNSLFYQPDRGGFFNTRTVSLVAATLLAMAWRLKRRHLLLLWLFVFLTPLPITFLPGRGGANLYIPLAGWGALAGSVAVIAGEALARVRWLRRTPPAAVQAALALCLAGGQWRLSALHSASLAEWLPQDNRLTASVLEQIRTVQPSVKPGANIYVIGDVFQGHDTQFLLELTYRDRSVRVWQDRYSRLTPAEIERMDYVLQYENGRLKRVKGT